MKIKTIHEYVAEIKHATIALLLVFFAVILIWNFGTITSLFRNVSKLSFGEFAVEFAPAEITDSGIIEKYLMIHRTSPKAKVIKVSPNKPEFIEICALEDIDLTHGNIGDSNDLLQFTNGHYLLNGDCVRIFTFFNEDAKEAGSIKTISVSKRKEIFKKKLGKGDSVVLFDASNNIVLDFEYWIPDTYE